MTEEQISLEAQARQRKVNARAFISGLDHQLLRHLARDLIELDFKLDEEHWPRWSCVAFINGLRLAYCEPNIAAQLLTPTPPALLAEGEEILARLNNSGLYGGDRELVEVRRVFGELTVNQPRFLATALYGLRPAPRLSRWFVASTVWGLSAGLKRSHLCVGHLIGYAERLSLGQCFVGNRLVMLARSSRRKRRPPLIDFIECSYRRRSCERRIVAAAAYKTFKQLRREEKVLHPGAWVLSGFRDGLILSVLHPELRDRLLSELSPQDRVGVSQLFIHRIGTDPAGWAPERLVGAAMEWLVAGHPHLASLTFRVDEFEQIRHLFDFSFWMGIAAGTTGK